jgi:hypothetical protein
VDPYLALGIRRGSTPEEVKEAFRALAWHAHPDRGGLESEFIRLSTAYNQIIEELARDPSPALRKPAPAYSSGRRASRRRARKNRFRTPPDPSFEPDLVIAGARPRGTRPMKPFDPDWAPDLVMLDEAQSAVGAGLPPDPAGTVPDDDVWLRRIFRWVVPEDSFLQTRPAWIPWLVLMLGLFLAILWACWVAWNQDTP